jgi:hypothetical protein
MSEPSQDQNVLAPREVEEFPEYGNDENKAIDNEINEKRGLIEEFNEEIEELEERVKVLVEHLKNVQ